MRPGQVVHQPVRREDDQIVHPIRAGDAKCWFLIYCKIIKEKKNVQKILQIKCFELQEMLNVSF